MEEAIDVEPGGFHSCSDIMMFMRLVAEKAEEWGEEIWAASLDLEKAFDKVYHGSEGSQYWSYL